MNESCPTMTRMPDRDRGQLSPGNDLEIHRFAKENGVRSHQVRELIRRHGASRAVLTEVIAALRRRSPAVALSDIDLPPVIGKRQGKCEADHFNPCPVCGQVFDMRDRRQAAWHAQPEHEPLDMEG
ncbi:MULTISPECIES: hypothetical protein [Mesorhizobium]|uniref:hypothetical protein n=1 Tax=Mesorhizobium sp. TaxID=1871066 RepID=UPI000B030D8D|nr:MULTISPECIES: hypothetical protein [Mesorhizobium]